MNSEANRSTSLSFVQFHSISLKFVQNRRNAQNTILNFVQANTFNMKTNTVTSDSTSHTFLTGAILIANLDYSGLAGYALRAAIGGAIWMVFKLAGDYISMRMTAKKKSQKEEDGQDLKEDDN